MEIVAFTPIIQAFNEVTRTLGSELLPMGKGLLFALGSVVLTWKIIMSYLNDEGINGMVAGLVEFSVIFGIPLWFLIQYDSLWGGSFVAGFDHIVSKLAGGNGVSDGVNDGIKMILGIGQKLFEGQTQEAPTGVVEAVGRLLSGLYVSIFKVLIVAVTICIAAYFAVYMLFSQILIGIALVIGPIFIPWLVLEHTTFIFNGWLRFIIIAGLYKVVGMLMLVYIARIIPVMKNAAANSPYPNSIDVIQATQVLIICGVMLMLAKQIPQIANGLLAGSNTASGKGGKSKGGGGGGGSGSKKPDGGGKDNSPAQPKGNTPPSPSPGVAPAGGSGAGAGGRAGASVSAYPSAGGAGAAGGQNQTKLQMAQNAIRAGIDKGGASIKDRIQSKK